MSSFRGAAAIVAAIVLGLLLSGCGNELNQAYKEGWNQGSTIAEGDPGEQARSRYCDAAEMDEYGFEGQDYEPVRSAYWTGCLNGAEGIVPQPPADLQSLETDP